MTLSMTRSSPPSAEGSGITPGLLRFGSRTLAIGLLTLLVASCGGSGGGNGNGGSQDETVAFPIDLPFTATITGLTTGNSIVGTSALGGTVYVGRWSNEDARGFLSFSLSPLPAGAVIVSAVVQLSGREKSGSPYSTFGGSPQVAPVDMGAAVSPDDFSSVFGTFLGPLPTWTSAPFQAGLIEGDALTGIVRADLLANRTRTSFRLRFPGSPGSAGLDEGVEIQVSQTDPSLRPVLLVTYRR